MTVKLMDLLNQVRARGMTRSEREDQRRSFAYGSAHIENSRITRDTVREAEESLKKEKAEGANV